MMFGGFGTTIIGLATQAYLRSWVGKDITKVCRYGFGTVGDDHNHCAHFVGHALGLASTAGLTCDEMGSKKTIAKNGLSGHRGVLVRVHNLWDLTTDRQWLTDDAAPPMMQSRLVFATLTTALRSLDGEMRNIPKKHVGIHIGGAVFHYGNTADKVREDSISAFMARMRKAYASGGKVVFAHTALPA